MTTFADRMKELRNENKMSQQELADKLKISRSSVGMYEQGRRDPDFELLDRIADLYNVDMSYMLGKSDVRGAYPRHGDDEMTGEELKIIAAYRSAPADVKRLILYALRLRS